MSNPFTAVGLKNVSPATFAPTIWVNDISGVSSELATALKTADAPAALAVWEKVQRLGLDKLSSMIENELSKSADFVYEKSRFVDCQRPTGTVELPITTNYVGALLPVVGGDYQVLHINSIHLIPIGNPPAEVTLKLFDLELQKEIGSYQIAPSTLPYTFVLRFDYPVGKWNDTNVFIGVDATGLQLRSQGKYKELPLSIDALIPGTLPKKADPTHNDFQQAEDSFIRIDASIRNDIGALVARYADRLGWAYAYVCASLLLSEKLASPNFNLYTNTNRGFTEEQIPLLMDEAVTRVRPIARDMLKELSRTETVTPKADGPYDAGYSVDSYC